jgi:inosine/xanthosine triphosphate pyrophosphatase family protein
MFEIAAVTPKRQYVCLLLLMGVSGRDTAPGVHPAKGAARIAANIAKLLELLKNRPDRACSAKIAS